MKVVGGWLAVTIGLIAAAGDLPATVNKVCRSTHRPFRTAGVAAVRIGPRVDIIEPRGHSDLVDSLPSEPGDAVVVTVRAAVAAASAVLEWTAGADVQQATRLRGLPYRAAPIAARADVIRPSERLTLPQAPPGTHALRPVSYFPPLCNRPPPSVS